jgi:hypothetical protein
MDNKRLMVILIVVVVVMGVVGYFYSLKEGTFLSATEGLPYEEGPPAPRSLGRYAPGPNGCTVDCIGVLPEESDYGGRLLFKGCNQDDPQVPHAYCSDVGSCQAQWVESFIEDNPQFEGTTPGVGANCYYVECRCDISQ